MIKRLVLAAMILLGAMSVAAQQNRDMLLTPDGTLHVIETQLPKEHPEVVTASNSFLVLTTRQGEEVTQRVVPGSLTQGIHTNAALAYDAESKTLFVLWQHSITLMQSELVLTSIDENGNWSRTTTFANANYRRTNLRIGVTRKIEVTDEAGAKSSAPEVNVHAVWWENPGASESAHYAMLTIEKGNVSDIYVRALDSFIDSKDKKADVAADPELNLDVLRQPVIFESPAHDTVDVLFGNVTTNALYRLRLKPVLDGRLRVPVGVRDSSIGAPNFRTTSTESTRLGALESGDRIVLYLDGKNAMSYVMYDGKEWSSVKSIAIDSTITNERVLSAIRQMLSDAE